MIDMRFLPVLFAGLAACSTLGAQNNLVVPASRIADDAPSSRWVAGFERGLRQQVLVDSRHLTQLLGRSITAMSVRRDAGYGKALSSGEIDVRIILATSPNTSSSPSPVMADNLGRVDATETFRGRVVVPASPARSTGSAAWDPLDSVYVRFTTPFAYQGGTLCVDVLGSPTAGRASPFWPADLDIEPVRGSAENFGSSCQNVLRDANGVTTRVEGRDFAAGRTAHFSARGAPGAPAFVLFGFEMARPFDLSAFGFPGCVLRVDPLAAVATSFGPVRGLARLRGGDVSISFDLPSDRQLFGARFAVQWMDLGPPLAMTNAIRCTIASGLPTLGLAMVTALYDGTSVPAVGWAEPGAGLVLRFEFQ